MLLCVSASMLGWMDEFLWSVCLLYCTDRQIDRQINWRTADEREEDFRREVAQDSPDRIHGLRYKQTT